MKTLIKTPVAVICLATASLLLVGCAGTFHDVKAGSVGKPPAKRPETLVVQDIKISDERIVPTAAANYLNLLGNGVISWNTNHGAFKHVIVENPGEIPEDAIVLTGTINDVEKGSGAMRFWVGMGAGQARVEGNFEIKDAHGKVLCTFLANRTYLGGTGLGGMGMLDFEELFTRLGWVLAETTDKWLKGEKLE